MMKKAIHKLKLQGEIVRDLQARGEHVLKHVRGGANPVMASDLVPETNHVCLDLAAGSAATR